MEAGELADEGFVGRGGMTSERASSAWHQRIATVTESKESWRCDARGRTMAGAVAIVTIQCGELRAVVDLGPLSQPRSAISD